MKKHSWPYLKKRVRMFLSNPFFWMLTIGGNCIIVAGATVLYFYEAAANPAISFFDCILWSTGIVTTVGYGEFTAVTIPGKSAILAMMLMGSLFIWSYMGFLVTGLMSPELHSLERDMHEVEREIHELKGPAV